MNPQGNRQHILAGCAFALLGLTASNAQALVMQADVEYVMGSDVLDTNSLNYVKVSDGPATSGSVDVLPSDYDGNGNTIFAHTYGDDSHNFGSRVTGTGIYNIEGLYSFSDTFTNNTGAAQQFQLDFTLIAGELMTQGPNPLTAGDYALAGFAIDILVNGTSQWSSTAELNFTGDGTTNSTSFTQAGIDIGGTLFESGTESTYRWNSYLGTVDLGTLGNGDAVDLEYRMLAYARGSITPVTVPASAATNQLAVLAADQVQNVEIIDIGREECLECGSGRAAGGSTSRSGDPFNYTSMGFQVSPTVAVPLPGTTSLLGLGMLGMLALRRRRHG